MMNLRTQPVLPAFNVETPQGGDLLTRPYMLFNCYISPPCYICYFNLFAIYLVVVFKLLCWRKRITLINTCYKLCQASRHPKNNTWLRFVQDYLTLKLKEQSTYAILSSIHLLLLSSLCCLSSACSFSMLCRFRDGIKIFRLYQLLYLLNFDHVW